MFPDFPEIKSRAYSLLARQLQIAIPHLSPLLRDVSRFHQHEGNSSTLLRPDGSSTTMDYPLTSFGFSLDREEMKRFDSEKIVGKLLDVAKQFADAQEKEMLQKASEAATSVGNTVSTGGGELKPEHLFEMLRRIWIDFDPETEAPRLPTFIVHPSNAAKMQELNQQWENVPELKSEHDRIMKQKLEEWRARENLRKLVD